MSCRKTYTYYSYPAGTCPQQVQYQYQYSTQSNCSGTTCPTASSGSTPSTTAATNKFDRTFHEAVLKRHNEYRRKHGAPEMTLDDNISNYAQEWANKLARENSFNHRTERKYGENLWCIMSSDPNVKISPEDAVNSWYDEIKYYRYDNNPNIMQVGHFTQVVWIKSTKLGVGVAQNGGRVVVVCNYHEHGNYMGQFNQNVLPPQY